MANNPRHMDNLKPFQKGDDPRRNTKGRKEKKWLEHLKAHGYENEEIIDTLNGLIASTEGDIEAIKCDPESTMLEKVCCEVVLKAMRSGSFFNMEMTLTRIFGKPKETVDATINNIPNGPTIMQVISTGFPIATSEKEAMELYK